MNNNLFIFFDFLFLMKKESLNEAFCIERDDFFDRTGLEELDLSSKYVQIVSPKQLVRIENVLAMKKKDLEILIRSMPLVEDLSVKPYEDCEIQFVSVDSNTLHVPQTYLLDKKLLFFMNGFRAFHGKYCCKGLSKLEPHYLIGKDKQGIISLAIYLPPIIERRERQDLLIDGNHRTALCGGVGATAMSIVVRNPSIDPPYTGVPWHTHIVSEKPPVEERYHDFNPALLKDFGHIGLDG